MTENDQWSDQHCKSMGNTEDGEFSDFFLGIFRAVALDGDLQS